MPEFPRIIPVPCLKDNYAYLLCGANGGAICIDPSSAQPITEALRRHQLQLKAILNTHHHWDHTGGNTELAKIWQCPVLASATDAVKISSCTQRLNDGEQIEIAGVLLNALVLPGHTLGHMALHWAEQSALFTGDTLFLMGCGRLFEGTAAQLFHSLATIKKLPPATRIFCGHEYTETNLAFALAKLGNKPYLLERKIKVAQQLTQFGCTIPGILSEEMQCNPFLLAGTVEDLAALRHEKDHFSG